MKYKTESENVVNVSSTVQLSSGMKTAARCPKHGIETLKTFGISVIPLFCTFRCYVINSFRKAWNNIKRDSKPGKIAANSGAPIWKFTDIPIADILKPILADTDILPYTVLYQNIKVNCLIIKIAKSTSHIFIKSLYNITINTYYNTTTGLYGTVIYLTCVELAI